MTYSRVCPFIVNKINNIFGLRPLIERLKQLRSYSKGIQQLNTTMESIMCKTKINHRLSLEIAFTILSKYATAVKTRKEIEKKKGAVIIFDKLSSLEKRNLVYFFNQNIYLLENFRHSLKMLVEEFYLFWPRSTKSCISFLTSRVDLMLKQIWGSESKIKIKND